MAIHFFNHVDLNDSQLQNAKLHVSGTAPTAATGQIYIDSNDSNTLKYYNGTGWVSLDGVGDISGVTAGVGISGGGNSGAITLAIDFSEFSTVTPANGDFLATLDSNGSTEQKTSIAALATLFAGSGLTATNSVIAVDTLNQNTTGSAGSVTNLGTMNTGDVTSGGTNNRTLTIGSGKVTMAKLANVATDTIIGRTAAGTGVPKAMSAAEVRTILNVADGSNANVSGDSGNAAIYDNSGTPAFKSGITKAEIQSLLNITDGANVNTDTNVDVSTLETRLSQINSNITIGNASTVNTTISGDLIVNGDTTTITSTIVAIGDNMMKMAKDNSANSVDIGWYGKIVSTGNKFPAMFYDASTGVEAPVFNVGIATTEPGAAGTATIAVKGTVNAHLTGNVTGNVSGSSGSTTGNAATATLAADATTLKTPRNINGVAFDGSAAITVTAAATSLTGTSLKSTVIGSSLTSVGTLTGGNATAIVSAASLTAAGKVELATGDEIKAGSDNTRAVTPAGLATMKYVADLDTDLATQSIVSGTSNKTIKVTHGLGSLDVRVDIIQKDGGSTVYMDVTRPNVNWVYINTTGDNWSGTATFRVLITRI